MKYRNRQTSGNSLHKGASLAAVILLVVFLLSSCTTYNSFKSTYIDPINDDSGPTITIGVFEPQSGRNAEKGLAELKGIELANSIYSNVGGYKVVLSKVDTQSSVSAAETAIAGLISMQPVAIIGAAGDATSLAAAGQIEYSKIPTITPSATNPLITQGNSFYFRASLTESQMGQGLAEYACSKIGSDRIGIISIRNDSSVAALIDGFEDKVREITGRKNRAVAFQSEINLNESEIKEALLDLRRNGINVCLTPIPTDNMDLLFDMVEERNMTDITFLGTRAWGETAFTEMMKEHPDVKVVFPYEPVLSGYGGEPDNITEEAQRFQIEYANKYGADDIPTYNAALGYDAYLILINAIYNAKSMEGEDVRSALMALSDLKCATGSFTFDGTGNVIRSVSLFTLQDGQIASEYVSDSETKSEELEALEDQQEES